MFLHVKRPLWIFPFIVRLYSSRLEKKARKRDNASSLDIEALSCTFRMCNKTEQSKKLEYYISLYNMEICNSFQN